MDDGRLVFARNSSVGELRGLVPLHGGFALIGSALSEAWSDRDGRPIWQRAGAIPGSPVFIPEHDEFWTVRPDDGFLIRFRAEDGTRVGTRLSRDDERVEEARLRKRGGEWFVVGLTPVDSMPPTNPFLGTQG